MCFEINTFLITSKEKFTKLSFCLLCFMGVRFGAYEKTYSTDSVASISVAFVACVVSGSPLQRTTGHDTCYERNAYGSYGVG